MKKEIMKKMMIILLAVGIAVAATDDTYHPHTEGFHRRVRHQNKLAILLGVGAGALVLVGLVVFACCYRARQAAPVPEQTHVEAGPTVEMFPISTMGATPIRFPECGYCTDILEEGERYRTLRCGHAIHDHCLASMLVVPEGVRPLTTCPLCRASLVEPVAPAPL